MARTSTVKDRRIITVKLTDIAEVKRVREGEIYKKGTIIIQVSATNGQVHILEKDMELESKYVEVIPKVQIIPFYLFLIIEMAMPKFLTAYKSGLNLQDNSFKHMKLRMHTSLEVQAEIVNGVLKRERLITLTEKAIESAKNVKANMLDNMFVGDIDKKKDREYLRKRNRGWKDD